MCTARYFVIHAKAARKKVQAKSEKNITNRHTTTITCRTVGAVCMLATFLSICTSAYIRLFFCIEVKIACMNGYLVCMCYNCIIFMRPSFYSICIVCTNYIKTKEFLFDCLYICLS